MRGLTQILVGVTLVGCLADPAAAQGTVARDGNRLLIDLGVSFLSDEGNTGTGFKAGLAGPISHMTNGNIALFGDFSFHTFDGFDIMIINGGPQVNFTPDGAKVRVFGRFGIGMTRFSGGGASDSFLSFLPGGGAGFAINDTTEIYGQYDRVITRIDGVSDGANRFSFGIVIRR